MSFVPPFRTPKNLGGSYSSHAMAPRDGRRYLSQTVTAPLWYLEGNSGIERLGHPPRPSKGRRASAVHGGPETSGRIHRRRSNMPRGRHPTARSGGRLRPSMTQHLTAEACALSRFGVSRSASRQSPRSIRRNELAVGAPSFRRDTHPPWSALRSTDIVAEVELDLDDPLFGDPPPKR
jgi:hypothetical protein